jgi:hypothetical protein
MNVFNEINFSALFYLGIIYINAQNLYDPALS